MADLNAGLGWSDAQWEMVNNAVTESFAKASVAGAFLPCYGPLPGSAENVRKEELSALSDDALLRVADDTTLKLFNIRVKVELSTEQVADDSLSSALLAFRRAANTLALVEDDIVFNGYRQPAGDNQNERIAASKASYDSDKRDFEATPSKPELRAKYARSHSTKRTIPFVTSDHPERSKGIAEPDAARGIAVIPTGAAAGERIVSAVVGAIGALEDSNHPGPFACVLGARLFEEAYRPTSSMVLPADRISPMLNGPLLRSGRILPDFRGLVVSLASGAIDIVVATPPKAQFLQRTPEAKFLFRVYERFVLRIKDKDAGAVRAFELEGL